eukprot:214926-Heterocapsa_arctica.AAC.1
METIPCRRSVRVQLEWTLVATASCSPIGLLWALGPPRELLGNPNLLPWSLGNPRSYARPP